MPEPIALIPSPALPALPGPTVKNGGSGVRGGNIRPAPPAAPPIAVRGEVSLDPASSPAAQTGGFEELLFAQLAMIGTTTADPSAGGDPAAAGSRVDGDAPVERAGEAVAAVLAESAALAVTTQIAPQIQVPPQIAPEPSTLSPRAEHPAPPASDPSLPETSDAIPVAVQGANQLTPSLGAMPARTESYSARRTSPRDAEPAGTVRAQADAEASDRPAGVPRPDRFAALLNPERSNGGAETPAQHLEPASMATAAPVQMHHLPELPPRIDVAPSLDSRPAAPVVQVSRPLASPEWSHEFGTQVTMFVSRKESQAEIRVNPPELGPVEVRIGFDGDKVSVAFAANPAETRQAIQDALPQLRELLAERGLSLGNTTVGAESSPRDFTPATRLAAQGSSREDAREPHAVHLTHRLVDTFA